MKIQIHSSSPLADCQHPRKEIVPLAIGLSWGNDGAIYQEKIDGVFTIEDFSGGHLFAGGATLAGDRLSDGEFIAWDCLGFDGQDLRTIPAWERLNLLIEVCRRHACHRAEESQRGGELLERVLARGGEGIVRKLPTASYYDTMQAAKRLQTWRCVITALDYATGGAKIADCQSGEDRGTVPLRARAGQCRIGTIIKVEGENLSARGLILKPRPCKDTETSWLIQY